MKNWEKFLVYCSGADQAVLAQCPTDLNKYIGIGATIFFTGLLAFFSSGYALYTVFDAWWAAILFGAVWGLMIFNLDRYIVMSMKRFGSWWRDFGVAFPRLLLASLLAIVISKPLEMKIFDKEIQAELAVMEQAVFKAQEDGVKSRFSDQINDQKADIDALKNELTEKTTQRDNLVKEANAEADGTGGSKQRNLGPIYLTKKAAADKASAELAELSARYLPQIEAKEQGLADTETQKQAAVAALQRSTYNGFAARLEALARISNQSKAMMIASLFITFLFVAIESAPILVKLISYRSPYDYLIHDIEHVVEIENTEKIKLRENASRHRIAVDTATKLHQTQAEIEVEKAIIDQKLREKLANIPSKSFGWNSGGIG